MDGWKAALRILGMGWYVAIAIILGLLGGLWLDGKFHTRPFFIIVGLVAGITVAAYGVYQMFLPFFKNKQGKGDS